MRELPQPPKKVFGFVEWFRPNDREHAEAAIEAIQAAGGTFLRTHLSWAEYHGEGGQDWYDWLIPHLGERIELLPCLHYTPPSVSRTGRSSGPPRRLLDYADFVDDALTRYGRYFPAVELWNEPNNLLDWDWRHDKDWMLFCEMIGAAAHWARTRGWGVVLGGPCPFDPAWLELMGSRGVLAEITAMGLHGFPGTWDSEASGWDGWETCISATREILDRYNPGAQIWITETGYSTWRKDEVNQVRTFVGTLDLPADRVYWYGWRDIPIQVPVQEGRYFDPRHYHLGMAEANGRPKLLGRLLAAGGAERAAMVANLASPVVLRSREATVITGGAGFIGCNLADTLLEAGETVRVVDNLSRPGVEENLAWLKARHGALLQVEVADLRDPLSLGDALSGASSLFHMAAQTAVTTSLTSPVADFETNAAGTLAVLEAVRGLGGAIPVVFASTNKVYGGLDDIALAEQDGAHAPLDTGVRLYGISEEHGLDFCTPYGCSKGVADQYVLDYSKTFGVPAAVLRMSCIYGPRQFGTEDQGWVAHFLISALRGKPVTIYGDGRQVRDILYISDAVAAYRSMREHMASVAGQAFNLGGGPGNAVSVRMVLDEAADLFDLPLSVQFETWRPGDQLYFVADTRKLQQAIGWKAKVPWRDGVARLARWLKKADPVEIEALRERIGVAT